MKAGEFHMTKVNDKVKYQRIFVIVLDSVGMGYMPDAAKFGDEGADTLGHLGKYLHRCLIYGVWVWQT